MCCSIRLTSDFIVSASGPSSRSSAFHSSCTRFKPNSRHASRIVWKRGRSSAARIHTASLALELDHTNPGCRALNSLVPMSIQHLSASSTLLALRRERQPLNSIVLSRHRQQDRSLYPSPGTPGRLDLNPLRSLGTAFRKALLVLLCTFLRRAFRAMLSEMSKRGTEDPLIVEIEKSLSPGRFFRRDEVHGFTIGLDQIHHRLEALVAAGEAARAVGLYEMLLSGIYSKAEECDDECYLSMSFANAFCGWIKARQADGRPAKETVEQILNWEKNDQYAFCFEIEKKVVQVLDAEGRRLLIAHFQGLVESALPKSAASPAKPIFEYDNNLRLPALTLKEIYESLQDVSAYAAVCERLGFSPRDCERLATMEKSKEHWAEALAWVDKGIALGPTRNWRNEVGYALQQLRTELLHRLGRKEDALAAAWTAFQASSDEFRYEELMRYVPKDERSAWHERAMAAASHADLDVFVSLCVKAREWEQLASRVRAAPSSELDALSHYTSEPAAKGLAKRNPLAAAKLYRALGMRILNSGKSKYYGPALDHFEHARDLYCGSGQKSEWDAIVSTVRRAHSRKRGFLSSFEQIVRGKPRYSPSFTDLAQERWKRLTS